jgi:hypothetical protein
VLLLQRVGIVADEAAGAQLSLGRPRQMSAFGQETGDREGDVAAAVQVVGCEFGRGEAVAEVCTALRGQCGGDGTGRGAAGPGAPTEIFTPVLGMSAGKQSMAALHVADPGARPNAERTAAAEEAQDAIATAQSQNFSGLRRHAGHAILTVCLVP